VQKQKGSSIVSSTSFMFCCCFLSVI